MDYFFPTEMVDAIVGACDTETMFTFTLVSKRYLQLFIYGNEPMVRDHKNYFYLPIESYFIGNRVGQNPHVYNNPSYIHYMQAKCRHKYTKIPSDEDMIKYVPFDHPKFDKELLSHEGRFNIKKNHNIICNYQDLESIKKLLGSQASVYGDYKMNVDDEVFEYMIEKDKTSSYDLYNDTYLTPKRIDILLSHKIYTSDWVYFLFLTDNLDIYKKVYQALIDHGINLCLTYSLSILPILPLHITKWYLKTINVGGFHSFRFSKREWNIDSVLYLCKKGELTDNHIWDHMPLSFRTKENISKLLELMPKKNITDLIKHGASLDILKLTGIKPDINIILDWPFDEEINDWVLEENSMSKKDLLLWEIDAQLIHENEGELHVNWILKDNLGLDILSSIVDNKLYYHLYMFLTLISECFKDEIKDIILESNNQRMIDIYHEHYIEENVIEDINDCETPW